MSFDDTRPPTSTLGSEIASLFRRLESWHVGPHVIKSYQITSGPESKRQRNKKSGEERNDTHELACRSLPPVVVIVDGARVHDNGKK